MVKIKKRRGKIGPTPHIAARINIDIFNFERFWQNIEINIDFVNFERFWQNIKCFQKFRFRWYLIYKFIEFKEKKKNKSTQNRENKVHMKQPWVFLVYLQYRLGNSNGKVEYCFGEVKHILFKTY